MPALSEACWDHGGKRLVHTWVKVDQCMGCTCRDAIQKLGGIWRQGSKVNRRTGRPWELTEILGEHWVSCYIVGPFYQALRGQWPHPMFRFPISAGQSRTPHTSPPRLDCPQPGMHTWSHRAPPRHTWGNPSKALSGRRQWAQWTPWRPTWYKCTGTKCSEGLSRMQLLQS